MNRFWKAATLLAVLLPSGGRAHAQVADTLPWFHMPPLVVTATRGEAAAEEVGSAISVTGRAAIERREHRTALDVLREMPGVLVAQAGGPGAVGSIFLRGAGAHQTLVLIDGVEANDPSSPTGAYDFAGLAASDVERIEVLRGPQSTLYGSAAMGGVIHVITRRGGGPARAAFEAEGGSRSARRWAARAAGSAAGWSGYAGLERRRAEGASATAPRFGGRERDGTRSTAFAGRLERGGGASGVGLVVRFRQDETDLDQGGFAGGDDPNYVGDAEELTARVEGRASWFDGRWQPSLALTLAHHDRSTRDLPDGARPLDRSEGHFEGRRWRLEWLHRLDLAGGRTTVGAETEVERARSSFESEGEFGPFASELPEASARTTGVFVQHEGERAGRLAWAVGGRVDDHEGFGTAVTWRVAPSWRLTPSIRLRGSWGTGFQAPTLFQLFDPQFGHAALDPEESRGWDAGVELDLLGGRGRLSATAFGTRFQEAIVFSFPDGYRNQGAASARGIEAAASVRPVEAVTVSGSWTWTRTADESGGPEDGLDLIRRPRHAGQVTLAWDPGRLGLAITARHVGKREDVDFSLFPAGRVDLDAYTVVRIAASWRAGERLRVFGRAENLFDESFEEVLGFGSSRRAFHLGAGFDL